MSARSAENDARVWIVQWVSEPMPHGQWQGDRFWPFVEVHESYASMWERYTALHDLGLPVTFREVTRVLPPG